VWRFGADREPLWVAADLGLAAAFQAAAFILFYSLSRRRAWVSVVAALAAVVPATMALNWAYSIVIPTRFLIEADTMAERGDWEVACRVPDNWLLAVRAGVDLPFERAGVAWLGTQLQVISYDAAAREVVVSSYPNQIFGLGLDGKVVWGPQRPPGLQNAAENFRRLPGGGWLTWDGYRENGRYLVAWSRDGTKVRVHEVPKGRSITSVATNPSGTLIGVSVGRNLSIGDVRDAVYVLRTDTGEEIYRRYLPAYTRRQLAFLGDELIAVTWFDGARGEVRVLRVSPQ